MLFKYDREMVFLHIHIFTLNIKMQSNTLMVNKISFLHDLLSYISILFNFFLLNWAFSSLSAHENNPKEIK